MWTAVCRIPSIIKNFYEHKHQLGPWVARHLYAPAPHHPSKNLKEKNKSVTITFSKSGNTETHTVEQAIKIFLNCLNIS